jgi:hypothetical protein
MYKLSWQDIETYSYACILVICSMCLVMICEHISSRCNAIFLTGDDCGVGWGWVGLAVGFFAIGVFAAWKVYRLVRERGRSAQTETT